jgi:hypothetical protein
MVWMPFPFVVIADFFVVHGVSRREVLKTSREQARFTEIAEESETPLYRAGNRAGLPVVDLMLTA